MGEESGIFFEDKTIDVGQSPPPFSVHHLVCYFCSCYLSDSLAECPKGLGAEGGRAARDKIRVD